MLHIASRIIFEIFISEIPLVRHGPKRYSYPYPLLRLARFFVATREYSGFHSWWKAKSLRILDRISKTVLCFLRPCPILAVLCFLKQRAHFLIATPEKKRRIESFRCHAVCQRHHSPATMAKYSWSFFLSLYLYRYIVALAALINQK